MKLTLIALMSAALFMGCSPKSSFNSDDQRFKSLMDGETVEVVDDQTLIDTMGIGEDSQDGANPSDGSNQGDDGLGNNDDSYDNGDDGVNDQYDNEDDYNFWDLIADVMRDGGKKHDNGKKDGTKGNGGKGYNGGSCRNRILDQDDYGDHDDMLTSPGEMQISKELYDAIKCSSEEGGKNKKVYICHYPNGDDSKKMTKCLPIPAVRAHVRQHQGNSPHLGHADFAGPCTDADGNPIPPKSDHGEE